MDKALFEDRFDMAAKGLNVRLYSLAEKLPLNVKSSAQEIRLRKNKPLCIRSGEKTYFLTENGACTDECAEKEVCIVSESDITETFHNLCRYSVYSRENEIRNGYITMSGGHRAGICGTAVYGEGSITNIREISSINLRISREIYGCGSKILEAVGKQSGFLVCGAPASGKTTIIRDIARTLSLGGKQVSVIDERGEIGGTSKNDTGFSDVLDGYRKGDGFFHAIRSLSPEFIICDELGNKNDIDSVREALNAGVAVIGTVHASSCEELAQRQHMRELLKTGAFKNVVFLKNRSAPGLIKYVKTAEEIIYGQNSGDDYNDSCGCGGRIYSF